MVEENAQNALELPSPQDLDEYDLETDDAEYYEPEIPQVAQLNCGDIVIKDSSNVQVGNRTYITGQVTIKQIVVPGDETKLALPIGSIPEGFSSGPVRSTNPLCESKEVPTGEKLQQFISHCIQSPRNIVLSLCAAVLLFGVILTIIYVSTSKVQVRSTIEKPQNRIPWETGRPEWGAKRVKGPVGNLYLPVHFVIISQTGTPGCNDRISCSAEVRKIQDTAMKVQNLSDIPYNFLVGGDGLVYEGRGWDTEGDFAEGFNNCSIGISFIGNFTDIAPKRKQIEVAKAKVAQGIMLEAITPDYKLLYQSQVSNVDSSGKELFDILKEWPHWSQDISYIFLDHNGTNLASFKENVPANA